ncbi:MAG: SUMF1/EgtB/PvdO family nonheme iron enzyme [Planctomycetota bacterium]|nr:SUMF1/EgtB/PvdO family nonheme iron enzyme [Planctomycetota bacterium]
MNREYEALQRAVAADPFNELLRCELMLIKARIDGSRILLKPLRDHGIWSKTPPLIQDMAILEVERRMSEIIELDRIGFWETKYLKARGCQNCRCRSGYWNAKIVSHRCCNCHFPFEVKRCKNGFRLATFIHRETGLELQLIPGQVPSWPFKKRRESFDEPYELSQLPKITVKPFLLGRWPVVEADDKENGSFRPLTGLDYEDSCDWLKAYGLRLPSREEWLYGAAGTIYDERTPWAFHSGIEPQSYRWDMSLFEESSTRKIDANSKPHLHESSEHDAMKAWNPFGLVDMFGNNWEWLPDAMPQRDSKDWQLIAGGSYKSWVRNLEFPFRASPPELKGDAHGFRAACSIPS